MKNYEELENFIKTHKNWQELLKPYMKSYNDVDYNKDWVVLMYCLFDVPKDPELFKVICECRGSVVNKNTGEIICAPFIKFWNAGEEKAAKIDWSSAWVSHKRDGWIFKMFKYNNVPYFMSNGKTISINDPGAPVDAIPGKPELKNMSDVLKRAWKLGSGEDLYFAKDGHLCVDSKWVDALPANCTICFELESPWNKIHTDLVDDAKLWFIMYRDPDGDEKFIGDAKKELNIPFDIPAFYNWKTEEEMLETLKTWNVKDNGEGVVVCDKNFNRVKIKIEDYRRVKFQSSTSDYGDNRLFKYFVKDEIDDLIAANPELIPRVELMREKMRGVENAIKESETFVKVLNCVDKRDFYEHINKELKGWKKYLVTRINGNTCEQVKEDLLKRWATKSNGYSEACKIVEEFTK